MIFQFLHPFDQMVICWTGKRPITVEAQVLHGDWSPWFTYAVWEKTYQEGATGCEYVDVDCISRASGVRVRVKGDVKQLHFVPLERFAKEDVSFGVRLQTGAVWSQMELDHPRANALCSPTSVAHALGILGHAVDPITIAQRCYDRANDIYGNWAFAVAAAGEYCGNARVRYLPGLGGLEKELAQNKPVVVSVRGALKNAPKVYSEGHLMTVIGVNPSHVTVLDSAFDNESQVCVDYPLNDFLKVWNDRCFLAYTF